MARLPDADAQALGEKQDVRVAYLSAESAGKQAREHPELTPAEYVQAQQVVDQATAKAQDGDSLIYIQEIAAEGDSGGYVMVVKATATGRALWVTSFRRLHRQQALRDSEISRLLAKGNAG